MDSIHSIHMKRACAVVMLPLLAALAGPVLAAGDTGETAEQAREREAREERVRTALVAADERIRSPEAREEIAERGFAIRLQVAQRNLGSHIEDPDAGYDQRSRRGIHQQEVEQGQGPAGNV